MLPGAGLQWDLFLRGAVASLLLFHLLHLALPGARPAARLALGGWTLSLIAYLFCQEPAMMLALPRPLTLLAMSLCVSSTAWMWVAARALFNGAQHIERVDSLVRRIARQLGLHSETLHEIVHLVDERLGRNRLAR